MTYYKLKEFIKESIDKKYKPGDVIVQYRTKFSDKKYEYALFGNSNSLWLSVKYDINPPFINTIDYKLIEEIYTKNENPEYFL